MDEEIQKIIEAERRRNREARERINARLGRARSEAGRIAGRLSETDENVRRIILFGSVRTGTVRTEKFDIDLAVEGGDIIDLYRLIDESEFEIDLVDLSSVSSRFREMVERRGEVLYDAGS